MDFDWPPSDMSAVSRYDPLSKTNISTKELDAEMAGARFTQIPGFGTHSEISSGDFLLIINNQFDRRFLISRYTDGIFPIDTNNP
jgi:hypothetical protein